MSRNPYASQKRSNPYLILAWLGLVAGLYGLFLHDARAAEPGQVAWSDPVCQAVAEALLDESDGPVGEIQADAGQALVDRASTARNCTLATDHIEAEVGSTSTEAKACKSKLYLYPDREPFIKRNCPL